METQNFNRLLEELKTLQLPLGEFALCGSAPMAARGLRDVQDLDIIVSENLYQTLKQKYSDAKYQSTLGPLKINDLEISCTWLNNLDEAKKIIAETEIINDWPFAPLKYVIAYKQMLNRQKDLDDLKLIEEYLLQEKS